MLGEELRLGPCRVLGHRDPAGAVEAAAGTPPSAPQNLHLLAGLDYELHV